jgi:hypothetical protein
MAISARRGASARPIFGCLFISWKASVTSFTVARDGTDPCETNNERASA